MIHFSSFISKFFVYATYVSDIWYLVNVSNCALTGIEVFRYNFPF